MPDDESRSDESQPEPSSSDEDLLVSIREKSCQKASSTLVDRYTDRLLARVQRLLGHRTFPMIEENDVVQSVWRTFFRNPHRYHTNDQGSALPLLSRIAANLTLRKLRFQRQGKRDYRRLLYLDQIPHGTCDSLPASQTDPVSLCEVEDAIERLEPHLKRIARLKLDGLTNQQIIETMELSERTYFRLLEEMRQELKKSL